MSLNYGAGEDSWESLGQQGHQTSQLVMPAPINQPWIFLGRTDAEAEAPILVPPDAKSQLTGKDPDAGKDWRQEKKGMTEDEMVGWHHQLREHEFEQTPGDSKTQPGVQQSRGLPSVRQDWGTEQLSPRRYSMKPALWTKTLVQPLASPLVFSLPTWEEPTGRETCETDESPSALSSLRNWVPPWLHGDSTKYRISLFFIPMSKHITQLTIIFHVSLE